MNDGEPTTFSDDDDAYEAWLSANPGGFIINCHSPPTESYLVLHRADCHHIDITRGRAGRRWTREYIKVCSQARTKLIAWGERNVGANPTRCRTCSP